MDAPVGELDAGLHALEQSRQVQVQYRAFSEEAERLGVFGAPTFVIPGQPDQRLRETGVSLKFNALPEVPTTVSYP